MLGSSSTMSSVGMMVDLRRPRGQPDREAGTALGAILDADGAVVFLDDTPRNAEAKPGAGRLGADERLEQPAEHAIGDSRSRVGDAQQHRPVEPGPQLNVKSPAVRHCVESVE